jgi:hypothetical protein
MCACPRALISIALPDFREEFTRQAYELRLTQAERRWGLAAISKGLR